MIGAIGELHKEDELRGLRAALDFFAEQNAVGGRIDRQRLIDAESTLQFQAWAEPNTERKLRLARAMYGVKAAISAFDQAVLSERSRQ